MGRCGFAVLELAKAIPGSLPDAKTDPEPRDADRRQWRTACRGVLWPRRADVSLHGQGWREIGGHLFARSGRLLPLWPDGCCGRDAFGTARSAGAHDTLERDRAHHL